MATHLSELVPFYQALLVDAQGLVSLLKERIQTVENRRVAKVSIFKENPFSMLDGFD